MMIDLEKMYHVGMVVDDLDKAMGDLSEQLGLDWAPLQQREIAVRYRGRRVRTDLRFTYSVQGPPHLELIEVAPGTPWEAAGTMHHIGFWADDLVATARSLEAAGLPLDASYDDPSGDPVGFAYFLAPSGLRIETVDAGRQAGFAAWLAGGDFPAPPGQ